MIGWCKGMSEETRGWLGGRGRGRSPHEQPAVGPAVEQLTSAARMTAQLMAAVDEQRAAGPGAGSAAGGPT